MYVAINSSSSQKLRYPITNQFTILLLPLHFKLCSAVHPLWDFERASVESTTNHRYLSLLPLSFKLGNHTLWLSKTKSSNSCHTLELPVQLPSFPSTLHSFLLFRHLLIEAAKLVTIPRLSTTTLKALQQKAAPFTVYRLPVSVATIQKANTYTPCMGRGLSATFIHSLNR